jgi:hypothetical protein
VCIAQCKIIDFNGGDGPSNSRHYHVHSEALYQKRAPKDTRPRVRIERKLTSVDTSPPPPKREYERERERERERTK